MHPHTVLASLLCPTIFLVTLCYTLACLAAPFGRCHRCHGTGHLRSLARGGRRCTRCDGTGRRLRLGRHLYNHLRNEYRHGNR